MAGEERRAGRTYRGSNGDEVVEQVRRYPFGMEVFTMEQYPAAPPAPPTPPADPAPRIRSRNVRPGYSNAPGTGSNRKS